ncbi:MAG: alanine--tRNA ligase [Synergistetes bacterium]|nr:alanine--tRNA ligase [Synergistota bacterium]MCX8128238.1 alanine--tRNA ligase [Synergistota bacterium]MDW8192685.1 alanine--tRNA ligase [Synergistota bacterium]
MRNKKYSGQELRKIFLSFFEERGHKVYPSFSLIPDDPTILLTIAGMVPFKPYFLGEKAPPVNRAVTCQKCVRTNDIENVGYTARHHTFFEMLGNFSFGDYFKKEAIDWAWKFVTEVLELPKERLWVTIYKDDEEAFDIWHRHVGLSEERIIRMGEEDNFWKVGPVGPCGPCSEIIIDQGEEFGCGKDTCGVGCNCDRYLELWNLVFMQYNRREDGTLEPLPKKNIDTGMGLERLASVMQGVKNDFETDLLFPIIKRTESLCGIKYGDSIETDRAMKIIADHIRALTFMISDGIMPSNEGRGYVLRRILRRAVVSGLKLGFEKPFLHELVSKVVEMMGKDYPEITENHRLVSEVILLEEERFRNTLSYGLSLFEEMVSKAKSNNTGILAGEDVFKLYDTYGFPYELTKEMAREYELDVDEEGFLKAMEEQKERARRSIKKKMAEEVYRGFKDEIGETFFLGYDKLESQAKVLRVIESKEFFEIILDRTPCYPEKGGQVGDKGRIFSLNFEGKIEDTYSPIEGLIVHKVFPIKGSIREGDIINVEVDALLRRETAKHHTATHLLHQALHDVLGPHVKQSGSLVAPDKLRFDFSHFSPLTDEELEKVERIVNEKIWEDIKVEVLRLDLEEAKRMGAKALFEGKYGEKVRVLKIGNYSLELCGGTHLDRTGIIGIFKIISETGIGANLRRIEAVCGKAAFEYIKSLEKEQKSKVISLEKELEELSKVLKEKRIELGRLYIDNISPKLIKGVNVFSSFVDDLEVSELRILGDEIKSRFKSCVIVLGSGNEDRTILIVMVTPDLVELGWDASKIVRNIGVLIGGGGGGKPGYAQAGGKNLNKLKEILANIEAYL